LDCPNALDWSRRCVLPNNLDSKHQAHSQVSVRVPMEGIVLEDDVRVVLCASSYLNENTSTS